MENQNYTVIKPFTSGWGVNFKELWNFRELLWIFIWRDIKVRYKQTFVGCAWAVIQPFLNMLIFTLLFGMLAKIPSQGVPYPVFSYAALLPWQFFARALTDGSNSLVTNQALITKVYFPRLLLPAASVLSGLVDFALSFLVFIGLMLYFKMSLLATMLWAPVFLLIALFTAFSLALWLSALNAIYRDIGQIIPFLVQIGMFVTPVIYPTSMVPAQWQALYALNPLVGVIEGFRWALLGSPLPDLQAMAVSFGMTVILFLGGLRYFARTERTLADKI